MSGYVKSVALLAVIALLVVTAAGCGNESSSASGGTTSSQGSGTTKERKGSSAPSKEFGLNNAAARFGHVASSAELEEVSKLVRKSLSAREKRDWAGQCETLSISAKESITFGSPAAEAETGCPAQLAVEAKGVPVKVLRNNMAAGVAVFRIQGSEGFALYHGDDGSNWAMPMVKEGGQWKVNALDTSELPHANATKLPYH